MTYSTYIKYSKIRDIISLYKRTKILREHKIKFVQIYKLPYININTLTI